MFPLKISTATKWERESPTYVCVLMRGPHHATSLLARVPCEPATAASHSRACPQTLEDMQKPLHPLPIVQVLHIANQADIITHMPGECYCRQLGSLLLYSCYMFWALINSLERWFWHNYNTNKNNKTIIITTSVHKARSLTTVHCAL